MSKQRMQAKSATAVVGRAYSSRTATGSPQARLRGEFESSSHEAAVNRYTGFIFVCRTSYLAFDLIECI